MNKNKDNLLQATIEELKEVTTAGLNHVFI